MTYGTVILLTQLFAVSLGGLFVWGFMETRGLASCMGDSLSLCIMENALLTFFVIGTGVTLAFALFLFKAYRER